MSVAAPAMPGGVRPLARVRARAAAVPRGFWACFVIAFVNACVWAVVTPSFQVPDEVPHIGYVQYLAETGRVPRPMDTQAGHFDPSQEELAAMAGVPFSYQGTPSWDPQNDRGVQKALSGKLDRKHEAAAGAAANYPPLYYALEAIPYRVFEGGSFFDRLLAMRIFSALFAGFTAGFCFLFARELFPGSRWAALAGGLAVAFQPLMSFVSGGVNPEALLYAASAALFFAVARTLRRGLTMRRALGIGAALAVALLAKGTAFGFVPGVILALALMIWCERKQSLRPLLKPAIAAVALGVVPFLAWLVFGKIFFDRPAGTATAGLSATTASGGGINAQLSYVWQLYLPRLPFMHDLIAFNVPRIIWFDGFVGRLGYSSYAFPQWVNNLALWIAGGLVALAGVAIVRFRAAVRARWMEVLVYFTMCAGVMGAVGLAIYRLSSFGAPVAQARYLLPLIPVYAALIALASRAGGRRFGPAIAAAIVVTMSAHGFAAVMLSIHQYYT